MKKRSSIFLSMLATAVITVGCGPSDATINTKVKEKLAADDTVKAALIDASTQKKVVTLSGTVDSQAVKDRAITVAHQVDGVTDVVDQVTVRPQTPGPDTGHEMMKKGMKMEDMAHGSGGKHN
jgi:hypothetical protein